MFFVEDVSAQQLMILKSMLLILAPVLTYTADEIVENAPSIIKGDAEDIFDLVYEELQDYEAPFDIDYMVKAREKFGSVVDAIKKDKIIKNTLELVIYTDSKKLKHIIINLL